MFTANARVGTERPGRYLVQLCQHIGHMSDKTRSLRHGAPGNGPARDQVEITVVESSDIHAIVEFAPWGRCVMRAEHNLLTLHLEATEEENMRRLQEILTRNLTRFGRRDHLEVRWDRPGTSAEPGSPKPRRHLLLGIIVAKVAIIALILMLPSGLALSLGASHIVVLAVLLVAAAATAIVLKRRGKPLRPSLSMLRHKGHR